jgi:hypothetical protein
VPGDDLADLGEADSTDHRGSVQVSLTSLTARIAVDPIFPPPVPWKIGKLGTLPKNFGQNNRYELLFTSEHLEGLKFCDERPNLEIDSEEEEELHPEPN